MSFQVFLFFNHNYMADQNGDSANTVLIVIILLILVGFGVWWFTMRGAVTAPAQENPGINIDVKLPTTTSGTGDSTTTAGTSTTAQ